jgi:GT2 family glycosyltransferase
MTHGARFRGFIHLAHGKSPAFALQALAWKLHTALQKGVIHWQERSGRYTYVDWIRENEPGPRADSQPAFPQVPDERPHFSLIAGWKVSSPQDVQALAETLTAQTVGQWEACLALGAGADSISREAAADLARRDLRFRLCPASDPSEPVLAALALARGDYILRLEAGDRLSPRLLAEAACFIEQEPGVEILYFDEDRLAPAGQGRQDPFFKPDWSPDLLLSTGYLDHALFKRSLVEQARDQAGEKASWDELVFRCVELAAGIGHLPQVLYHRHPVELAKGKKGEVTPPSAGRLDAITAHLERSGLAGASAFVQGNGQVRVSWPVMVWKVSIIIPTRDHVQLLRKCLASIQERTRSPDYEILLVDSGSLEPETRQYYAQLSGDPRVRIIEFPGPFNYSAANNLGAQNAAGEILLFLNNDTEAIDPSWLEELARWTARPEIGIVGGKLLYPDRKIQHAGIVVGMEGHGSHVFSGFIEGASGPFGSVDWYRDYSAVTGACLAIRREVFAEIGGFDERYKLVFNDIEICQRARAHGYRVVYTPYARLIHYEGQTRFRHIPAADIQLGYNQLKDAVQRGDPYYNPNLSYAVRIPTFRRKFEDSPGERLKAIACFNPDI